MPTHTAEVQKQKHSLSQKLQSVDRFTMTDFELRGKRSPPYPLQKLLKDASSMTDSTSSILLVNSAVQACETFKDVGCQSEPPTTEKKTELIPSKSSYYSLGNFSDLRRARSYSDGEYTLVPEKSCEILLESSLKSSKTVGKPSIPRSETRIVVYGTDEQREGAESSVSGVELVSSSAENVRKHRRSAHKHMWQQQVKTLQQRLRTLRRQV